LMTHPPPGFRHIGDEPHPAYVSGERSRPPACRLSRAGRGRAGAQEARRNIAREGLMAVATETIDISRSPDDVFWDGTDFAQFRRWQGSVVSVRAEGESVLIGSRAVVTRRVGPRRVRATETITELTPPKTWEVRSSGGLPVTAIANGRIEPLNYGK